MEFSFALPAKPSDLLRASGDHFFVRQVYTLSQLRSKLEDCRAAQQNKDAGYIIEHFDTFFSAIELKDLNCSDTILYLKRSFELLFVTVKNLTETLATLFAASSTTQVEDRIHYLNLTKMTIFLEVNIVKRIDTVVSHHKEQSQMNAQKKRGKQQTEIFEQYPDWERKRLNFLVQLYNLLELQIEKLWSPPMVEENFINMICDICYRTLETTPLRAEQRRTVETVFQILGIAIKRYNHALTFPVRILQMLRSVEHLAHSLPVGINILYEEYGLSSVFGKLLTEIQEALTMDASDTAVSRNFSTFLTEFANLAPKLMIPHLSELSGELLECESHVLRNCILQIMGDAITSELTSEDLSEEMKEARDEFLNDLLLHINDISAHVRSKVLHIWQTLKVEEAVPLSYQLRVLIGAVERLEDKTATVRKQAIQLIKAFLERNPFSSNLTLDELNKKHEEACLKMEELSAASTAERKKAEELEEHWEQVLPELEPIVKMNIAANLPVDDTPADPSEFGPRIAEFLVAKKYKEAMEMARRAEHASANEDLAQMLNEEERCLYYVTLMKSYMFLANGHKDLNEQLGTQIKTVTFLQDSIKFSKVITEAVPKIQEMLLSKTNSDVFEAVELFTTGYLFGIKGTECGMRRMLNLVWSSDKEKREAVSNAYRRVLFTTDQQQGRAHAIKVVQNLSRFLEEIDYGNYTAMECLIAEWIGTDDIDALIVQVLFERFSMKLEGTTKNESRLALQLLIMCSQTKSSIAASNISVIETIGLDERGKHDPRLYCGCLEFLINSIDPSMSTKYYKRYEPETPVVQKVIEMYKSFFFHPRIKNFDAITMRTMEYFYKLCQKPDVICQKIVIGLIQKFQEFLKKFATITVSQQAQALETPYSQQIPETQQSIRVSQTQSDQQTKMPAFLLTRFVFMIGYMTMKEMIFLDIDVYNNQKFRQELGEFEEKKKNKNNLLRRRTNALNMSATESLKRLSGTTAEPQQEPDEDLVGATAEDNIAEMITLICEDVLLYDSSALLSKIFPIIIEICKYPAKYRDSQLQQSATLTLIRFMCVSSKFCAEYLPFLMNILQFTKNITIKCNIVIGLSDLTFRFPNIIEPWTGVLYTTLFEENTELRLTAVKMLSHLVLHEMIRVKGQIADLAMCIVDDNEEIRNITQQFFKEISNKSNILYNVLPDIISKLSDVNTKLEEDKYRTIMRYILGLIQKDRQVETLVEKLCLRFPATHEERQWRDISYCLSLLSYNERSIKKLIDNINCFKDKVQTDEVYQLFKLIITNTSKLAKPELKAVVNEFEARLNDCLSVRDSAERDSNPENEGTSSTQTKRPNTAKKITRGKRTGVGGGGGTRPSRGRRLQKSSSSSASSSSSESSEDEAISNRGKNNKNKPTTSRESKTPARTSSNRGKSRNVIVEESLSSDEEESPQHKRGRSSRKK